MFLNCEKASEENIQILLTVYCL